MKALKLLAVLSALLTLSGCVKIWQDNQDIKTYMLQIERPGERAAVPDLGNLLIEEVHVLPPYNVRSLTVRESDVEFSTTYYSELLMSPAENFRNLFYDWFSASGRFNAVSVSGRSEMKYRLVATVMDFYGDRESSEAVLRMKVSLFGSDRQVLLHNEYMERVSSVSPAAEDYIRAYNQAVEKILLQCENDIVRVISAR
ncbi:ABC-type transport auxiliary lipoprotein family protein [Pontiella agarivorans]|uniref:ABC-type transport auxiliary lipoprotein family protein n=1 Tax=Pontiella agarivorans TaxID=3038953 RepID=A0ABU5MTF7_9BACT|nr:ABC-type transport auxiliary lipoprotein family protein [Pontiella agarivorans]MDZ8117500.1 ABC-type transport auxiliary lipoprotein family protein [Pontiella agarivorans]